MTIEEARKLEGEEWVEVCPGYFVSRDGVVRHGDRVLQPVRIDKGKRRPCVYHRVCLGRFRTVMVHTLVLEAFVGPRPTPKHQAAHEDGNPENNCVGNLSWKTATENARDKIRHDTAQRGDNNPTSKLRERDIPEIHAMRKAGSSYGSIARRFGVNQVAIKSAVLGRTWRRQHPQYLSGIPEVRRGAPPPRKFGPHSGRILLRCKELGISSHSLADIFGVNQTTVDRAVSRWLRDAKQVTT